MPKLLPSNSMPWPKNLIYDFRLSPSTSPEEAEGFIDSLPTSDKNKAFLRLRYRDGQSYADIAPTYGLSAGGVRQAIKYVRDRYNSAPGTTSTPGSSTDTSSPAAEQSVVDILPVQITVDDMVPTSIQLTQSEPDQAGTDQTRDAPQPEDESKSVPDMVATQAQPGDEQKSRRKIKAEFKPIIKAISTTTRQNTFVYDSKTRIVLAANQVPRGLRKDPRYIPLPDYYQIKEYDLMGEFAADIVSSELSSKLQEALGGVGPFKAFKSAVKELGLEKDWSDFRYNHMADLAEDWWEHNVISPAAAFTPASASSFPVTTPTQEGKAEVRGPEVLVVNPATLNGIALIETIRILYRRVGPADFEAALDELRDALCVGASRSSEEA